MIKDRATIYGYSDHDDRACAFYVKGKQVGSFYYTEHHAPNDKDNKNLYIYSVRIRPEHRGKGFGKKMMKESIYYLKNRYPDIKKIYLETDINNVRAMKSYLYAGYKIDFLRSVLGRQLIRRKNSSDYIYMSYDF